MIGVKVKADYHTLPRQPSYPKIGSEKGEFDMMEPSQAFPWENTQNDAEDQHRLDDTKPTHIKVQFHDSIPRAELSDLLTRKLITTLSSAARTPEGQKRALHTWVAAAKADEFELVTTESFNHKGMTGNLYSDVYVSENEVDSHWRSYFNAYGVTSLDEKRKGSRGRGKEAIEGASKIGLRLVYTVREGDEEYPRALMGALRTCDHEVNGVAENDGRVPKLRMTPYTFFCADYEEGVSGKGVIPVTDDDTIDRLAKALRFTRKPYESGVSHAILQPRKGITPDSYARRVLSRFLLPILRGEISFEIRKADSCIEIHSGNVREVVLGLNWDEEPRKIGKKHNFAALGPEKWSHVISAYESLIEIPGDESVLRNKLVPNFDTILTWDPEWNQHLDQDPLFSEQDMEEARKSWEENNEIRLEMKISITRRTSPRHLTQDCEYQVVIRKVLPGFAAEFWSRGGMVIPFEGALEDAQYLAVVDIPTSCNLGLMLRDAEGEGHLDWRPTAQSRRHMFTQKEGQWDDGKDIVEFIQQTIDGVMKHLFPIEKEAVVEDEEFSHTIRTLVKTETEEGEDEEEEDPDPCDDCGSIPCICIIPPPPGKEKVASIKARPDSGEVRVLRNPRLALAGEKVKINTAIMNNRANSFTRYREFDFTPDDISCNLKGCELISVDYNKAPKKRGGVAITISIDDDDWRADISGFPIDRDIDTFTGLVQ